MRPSSASTSSSFVALSTVAVVGIVSSALVIFSKKYHDLSKENQILKSKLESEQKKKRSKEKKLNKSQQKQAQSQSTTTATTTTNGESASETSTALSTDITSKKLTPRETLESTSTDGLLVKPIGILRSIYRLCVGTPRQGLLAPNARGCIEMLKLGDASPASSVSGLEGYSHIWILFVFHLNTKQQTKKQRFKSKIAPPALGGGKVGIFATRTPHRYNPIGITLCKLDRIEVQKQNVKLHVSGLDLVDGTPILDIKPYVPVYDSVPPSLTSDSNKSQSQDTALENDNNPIPMSMSSSSVRVPHWVAGGLATKRNVSITETARKELETILANNPRALQFYGPSKSKKKNNKNNNTVMDNESDDNDLEYVLECIRQVLAIDVRSSYQTKKARQGKFQAERADRMSNVVAKNGEGGKTPSPKDSTEAKEEETDIDTDTPTPILCTQQLDNLLIQYQVQEADSCKRSTSEGSGAEDVVSVLSIQLLLVKKK